MRDLILRLPVALAAVLLILETTLPAAAAKEARDPLLVVTTSTTFASLVESVGGDLVRVEAIAAPCDDVHFIEPRPSHIMKLARAQAFVHAGLDLELWRGPLVEAARNRALLQGGAGEIDLSQGVELLDVPDRTLTRAEGDIHIFGNPHYWMSPANVEAMSGRIAERLASLAPAHAETFRANRDALVERVESAARRWIRRLEPFAGSRFVAYHRDWPYFAEFFSLATGLWIEPKPNIPPSAKHIQAVIAAMRAEGLDVVVREPFHPPKTARTIAEATGARVAVLSQHVGCLPGTGDYIALMDANVEALAAAFEGGR